MTRLRLLTGTVIGLAMLLTACDQTPVAPVIHFVGNSTCPTDGAQPYDPSPPQTNGTAVGTAQDEMPHTHVAVGTPVTYLHDPPTSGCHYNIAASATQQGAPIAPGVYDQELQPEYWMHNIEHGYIAVLYNCPNNSCPNEFAQLRNWAKALPVSTGFTYAKIIVIPWHSMKDKFALVSWDWYLGLSSFDMTQIQAFYDNHKDHAPEVTGG